MEPEEDPRWRDRIDSVVLYDKLEDLRSKLKELERDVRGGRDSLLSEYRRHDQELTRINAVLFQDPTGQKGLLHDVDLLMGRRGYDNQHREFKWKYRIPTTLSILAMVLTCGALTLTILINWPTIIGRIQKMPVGALEEKIEQARRPKGKPLYRVRHHSATTPPPSGVPDSGEE